MAWLWFWLYSFLSEDGKNNGESEMCETTTVIIDTSNIKVEDGGLIHLEECPEDDESKKFSSFSTLYHFYTILYILRKFLPYPSPHLFFLRWGGPICLHWGGQIQNWFNWKQQLFFDNYNCVLRAKKILYTVVLETCSFHDCWSK